MREVELFIIAIGLSMDAFAVAICKGLSLKKMNYKHALITAIFFGGFQAIMPLIGYFFGTGFKNYITSFDHWIAFIILSVIGLRMIKESGGKQPISEESFSLRFLTIMALATSIDALAIGVTFAFFQINIILAAVLIGSVTFIVSLAGVKIGNIFGGKHQKKAEIAGGIILIIIGIKLLIEHIWV